MSNSTVIPCLRYRDAPAAIEWLCRVFGFEKQAVYAEGEVVMHAQLVLAGGGMVMLGSVKDTAYDRLMRQPAEAGGNTQSSCLVVADPDAVYARARAEGATIVMDISDKPYGGRDFTCLDPEGHVWSVGSYDPWAQNAGD